MVGDGKPLLSRGQLAYLLGLAPLELYCTFVHARLWHGALPFAPLMATSAYCAAGIVGFWAADCSCYVALARLDGGADIQRRASEQRKQV